MENLRTEGKDDFNAKVTRCEHQLEERLQEIQRR